ncbi:M15 family metallopeptidase [Bacillus sp. FSL L8-0637]|uniref:M15 family metallopeptidase n=1 Tax=Bacillus sp. FSL L8-0637 TaxID=2954753 RepID=UPI0030FBA407
MYYHNRNVENLQKLAPHTRAAAMKWYQYCQDNGIEILIYETTRSVEQQRKNVATGASQTMRSYHIVGQALDFVPAREAEVFWDGYYREDIQKAVRYAKSIGFEWGGDWKDFVDSPHLQYNYNGYGTDKGEVSSEPVHVTGNQGVVTVTVDVARIRREPTTDSGINVLGGNNGRITRNSEWQSWGSTIGEGGYTWYNIGTDMWVRGDLVSWRNA